jgi:hypothetical protein
LIYAAKLLAAWLVSAGLAAVFSGLALVVINWDAGGPPPADLAVRVAKVAALGALSMWAYVVLFGAMARIAEGKLQPVRNAGALAAIKRLPEGALRCVGTHRR